MADTQVLKPSPFKVNKKVGRPYGISSRVKFDLRVVKSDGDSFILSPFGKTAKEFYDGDIANVENFSQQQAVAQGYIHIVR
jgi:hypothetical protein